jgi:hypothetical protein
MVVFIVTCKEETRVFIWAYKGQGNLHICPAIIIGCWTILTKFTFLPEIPPLEEFHIALRFTQLGFSLEVQLT